MSLIILGFAPLLCGLRFYDLFSFKRVWSSLLASYVVGFFVMLAGWECICLPAAYLRISFNAAFWTFIILLIIYIAYVIRYLLKKRHINIKTLPKRIINDFKEFSKLDYLYLAVFLLLLLLQVYYAARYSPTHMMLDDVSYIGYAQTALDLNVINSVNPENGLYQSLDLHRTIPGSIIYFAVIAKVVGMSALAAAHTVANVYLLVMAYMVYALMAEDIFKKRDNKYIFLIILSLLYIYGYYSRMSMTYRLLCNLWQGKAIMAVILCPFLFVLVKRLLENDYSTRYGVLVLILSIASTSLTLTGTLTFLSIMGICLVLGAVRGYGIKKLLYLVWGAVIPGLAAGLYILERLGYVILI